MIIKKPPIVTILGHVDHGKTTLLDYIRKSNIALKEAGFITQKIGAYEIEFKGEKITFIDTPGHLAFTKLRERGAKVSDIGVLVIAADEGVKPQTKESLEFLKIYKIPFIVALNKIDKKEADPERVLAELVELGVIPEKWGGDIPVVNISAKTGEGVDELLDLIILLRDLNDLKTENEGPAKGFILEATKDPKRGNLASLIVSSGHLKLNEFIITSSTWGKIKFLEDDLGRKIDEAYPCKPIIIGNFESLPLPGEEFEVGDEKDIKEIQKRLKEKEISFSKKYIFISEDKEGDMCLIIKADHIGSLEALDGILTNLANKYSLNIKIIKQDLGSLSFQDLDLAKETKALILTFNLKNPKIILEKAKELNVKIIEGNVIYELEEKLENLILSKEEASQKIKGELVVLATFNKTKTKKTVGGKVELGKIKLGDRIIILRGEEMIGKGRIISLEKNRIPAEEVQEGELCGLIIETTKDIEINDIIRVE